MHEFGDAHFPTEFSNRAGSFDVYFVKGKVLGLVVTPHEIVNNVRVANASSNLLFISEVESLCPRLTLLTQTIARTTYKRHDLPEVSHEFQVFLVIVNAAEWNDDPRPLFSFFVRGISN